MLSPKFEPDPLPATARDPIKNPDGSCIGATQTIDIIVNAVSPKKANNIALVKGHTINFRFYHKPVHTYFFLQASPLLEQTQKFEIVYKLGQIIMKGQFDAGNPRGKVKAQALSGGIYLVRISNE